MAGRESPFTLVASVPVWILAMAVSALLLLELKDPHRTCERTVPSFEGIAVEEATVTWPPSLIRCSLVDRDPEQRGERTTTGAWGWPALAVVIALDLATAADVVRRVRSCGTANLRHN